MQQSLRLQAGRRPPPRGAALDKADRCWIGRLRNCIARGPAMLDLPHQPDEYGDVEDMLDAATVLGLALGDLLGTGGGG